MFTKTKLCTQRCSECLLSSKKIVDKERMKELLTHCKDNNDFFLCHKGTLRNERWICRGIYDEVDNEIIAQIHQIEPLLIKVNPDAL